jgi:hypothetical protein
MWAGGWNDEFIAKNLPSVLAVKRNRSRAGIAPELMAVRVICDGQFDLLQQQMANAATLKLKLDGHAAQLPGGLVQPGVMHDRDAADDFFLVDSREVNRRWLAITVEDSGFARQAGAKNSPAEIDDLLESRPSHEIRLDSL